MRNTIKKIPIPFSGLMLAMAAAGNLLGYYSSLFHNILGLLSFSAFLLIILKLFMYPKIVINDLKNPILYSVSGTLIMGLFFLSTYLQELIGNNAIYIWYLSLFSYFFYIIGFTASLFKNFNIKEVCTGYFIVYIGIVAASNTAYIFQLQYLGQIIFYIGLAMLFPILTLICYRYIRYPEIHESKKPLLGIFAAPFPLLLAGYMHSFSDQSQNIILFLTIFSVIFYLLALLNIKSIFKSVFYPSIASYTFPFVNSAIALRIVLDYYNISDFLRILNIVQIIIAVLILLYVSIRYSIYFFKNEYT